MVEQDLVINERSQELAQAARQVDRFVHRFQPNYRLLAYYAALPLILTPELLHYLRIQFLRGEEVPWVAEVDLLLSDLCQPVGYEQYAMETAVRAYLIQEMEHHLGRSQMVRAASILIRYVEELARTNAFTERELEAQHLAALLILDEEQAVRQVAMAYSHTLSSRNQEGLSGAIRSELVRLSSLTQELAPQIQQYENLVNYARVVQQLLTNTTPDSSTPLQRSFPILDGLELSLPDELVPTEAPLYLEGLPSLQPFEFEVATISLEESPTSKFTLVNFEFETATLTTPFLPQSDLGNALDVLTLTFHREHNQHFTDLEQSILVGALEKETYSQTVQKVGHDQKAVKTVATQLWGKLSLIFGQKVTKGSFANIFTQWLWHQAIHREYRQGQQWVEDPGNGITLAMVYIPGGSFQMGSPEDELERLRSEGPQHLVTISPFLISKFPITQRQWRTVVAIPQVNRSLEPDPSNFKGEDRPVENVSWFDAIEFCDRLSQLTDRPYRLPTEAEWEYACRAGTTTPFHFGETITPDLANYAGNYNYSAGPKGVYREETTPVGSFPANAFGLYDMHGNVWEWCLDHWHGNYEGAPTDGSAWVTENEGASRLLRGGSWYPIPGNCRSACRYCNNPDGRLSNLGFRVVCAAARTLA